jgi:hypothetical protein
MIADLACAHDPEDVDVLCWWRSVRNLLAATTNILSVTRYYMRGPWSVYHTPIQAVSAAQMPICRIRTPVHFLATEMQGTSQIHPIVMSPCNDTTTKPRENETESLDAGS